MELTNREWKEFVIEDLFKVKIGKNIDGNKIDKVSGKYAYITRKESNNGLDGFIDFDNSVLNKEFPVITIGNETAEPFVQEFPFFTGTKVNILIPKTELSSKILFFILTSLKTHKSKYSYSFTINSTRLKRQKILLPINSKGKPDYAFMESYMKQKEAELLGKYENYVSRTEQNIKLNSEVEWKEFLFPEVFEIKNGFYNKKPISSGNGKIPFLGATANNNGITGYYTLSEIEENSKIGYGKNEPLTQKLFKGNCIAVTNNGSVGYAYYQVSEFTCSHDVNPLYLKNHTLNPFIAKFLITAIEQQRVCFEYARKWRPMRMKKSKILLPVNSNGQPDFVYMENYIRVLENQKLKQYIQYKKLKTTD